MDNLKKTTETSPDNSSENDNGYVPAGKHESALYAVYRNRAVNVTLRASSYICVIASAVAYLFFLVIKATANVWDALRFLTVTAIPFVIVTVLRSKIPSKRPYEIFSFYEKKPKNKTGKSFPSRHVFSIFIIGVMLLWENVAVGLVILGLGIVLAVARVLLGIHFVRDVVAGALIGAVCGAIGVLLNWLV